MLAMESVGVRTLIRPEGSVTSDDEFRIKGSSIATKLSFIAERYGSEHEASLREWLDDRGYRRILDASWYPFTLFEGLLFVIVERHYDGQVERIQEVGVDSAQRTLTSTYGAFIRGKAFGQFLALMPQLHPRIYSHGTVTPHVDEAACQARIALRDLPKYSDPDLFVSQGFFLGAAKLLGLPEARGSFARVEGGIDFSVRWDT